MGAGMSQTEALHPLEFIKNTVNVDKTCFNWTEKGEEVTLANHISVC